jgi:hypothetical protein
MAKVWRDLSTSSKNDSDEETLETDELELGAPFRACLDCYTVTFFHWIDIEARSIEAVHFIGLICVHISSSPTDGFLVRAPNRDQKRFPRALAVNAANARQRPPKPPSPSSCQAPSPVLLPEYACTVRSQFQRQANLHVDVPSADLMREAQIG